jgi:LPS sulfotransferase NodH
LLCEALEFTAIAGRPREYFEPAYERDWFTRLGITTDAEYVQNEDFIAAYESTVLAILRHLQIAMPDGMSVAPPRLQKLADDVSHEWADRYRAQKWPPRPCRIRTVRSCFISTGPRTGGFLLAEALESTAIAGRPREYFDPVFHKDWCAGHAIKSDAEFYERVFAAGTTSNGVFGAKVLWHQFEHLLAGLRRIEGDGLSDLELLRLMFPDLRYIFLTRKDKIRQAISYDRAIRSGVWWSLRPGALGNGETPAPAPVVVPPFDFAQLDLWVTRLTEFDSRWRRHFKRVGTEPFEVAYEDLVLSYESTVFSILRYLDLPISASVKIAPPRLRQQADQVTEEWVRRYEEIKSGRAPVEMPFGHQETTSATSGSLPPLKPSRESSSPARSLTEGPVRGAAGR